VGEAYHVLSDPDRRAHYDRFGRMPTGVGPDVIDLTDMFEGVLGDILSGIGGFGRPRKNAGRDVRLEVEITLPEAASGVEKTVEFTRPRPATSAWDAALRLVPWSIPARPAAVEGRCATSRGSSG